MGAFHWMGGERVEYACRGDIRPMVILDSWRYRGGEIGLWGKGFQPDKEP